MSKSSDYQFEYFEKYVGTIEEVKEQVSFCPHCKSEFIFSHLPDYKNLTLQEVKRCVKCGKGGGRIIHIMN
ncbi:MAG: hypothetical protein OXB88_10860 [Bacteriovoracales bacterium]|nr:hypothetical protein [Bacteriovoracales bacterium]